MLSFGHNLLEVERVIHDKTHDMVRRLFTIGCAALRLAFKFVTPQCQFLPAPARPVLDDYAGTIAECGLQETLAPEFPDASLERSIGMHAVRRSGSTKRPRSATAAGKRGSGSLLHPASTHRAASGTDTPVPAQGEVIYISVIK